MVEPGIPDPDRRAEQARRAAGGGGDRVLGGADLALHRARAVEAEGMGMAEGVVLDAMPAAVDLGHEAGMRRDLAPETEEGGARPAPVEPVQDRRRDLRMWPVVEGERDIARGPGEPRHVGPEQGAARPHRGRPDEAVIDEEAPHDERPALGGEDQRGRAGRVQSDARAQEWRQTPGLGAHARGSPARPLTRASSSSRLTFPRDVRGIALTSTTDRGTLCSGRWARHQASTSS